MAENSSPFSFHCMICFEEFDSTDIFPVVLPCGHTYICSPCANRLDKCMECRTSLFYTTSQAVKSPQRVSLPSVTSSHSRRVATTPGSGPNSPTQQSAVKTRLPLPKNVVLLALMEATEFASENAALTRNCGGSESCVNSTLDGPAPSLRAVACTNFSEHEDESSHLSELCSDEQDEGSKIKISTSVVTGACGTYAVASKEGLIIYPSWPGTDTESPVAMKDRRKRHTSNPWELDVNNFLKKVSLMDSEDKGKNKSENAHENDCVFGTQTSDFERQDANLGRNNSSDECLNESKSFDSTNSIKTSMRLSYGDRVQVVTMVDGWAKLARGYGFIHCKNRNDLVKVGGPVDKACSLEAVIHYLSLQRARLKTEQCKIERLALAIMKDFQASLIHDEDMTVISAEAFSSSQVNDVSIGNKDSLNEVQHTNPLPVPRHNDIPEPLDTSIPNLTNISVPDRVPSAVMSTGPSSSSSSYLRTSIMSLARRMITDYLYDDSLDSISRRRPSPTMLAGAESWRRRNGREAARGIDFRTGMSGHYGILGHHAHPHDYVNDNSSMPKMSMHSGLTVGPSHRGRRRVDLSPLNCGDEINTEEILASLSYTSHSDFEPNDLRRK